MTGHSSASTGSVPPHIVQQQATSPRRFLTLLAFSMLTIVNGYTWLMFEPIEQVASKAFAPQYTSDETARLGSWQPLVYVLLFLPITRLLMSPNGLTRSMRIAIACELVGCTLKLFSILSRGTPAALQLINAGQIFSAISSPVAIGAPSQLSAEWFPPQQRTQATAAGVLSNNVGNAIVYLAVPTMASYYVSQQASTPAAASGGAEDLDTAAAHGMLLVFLVEAVLAIGTAALIGTVLPTYSAEELETPVHSAAESEEDEGAAAGPPLKDAGSALNQSFTSAMNFGSKHGSFAMSSSAVAVSSFAAEAASPTLIEDEDFTQVDAKDGSMSMASQLLSFACNYSAVLLFAVYAWTSGAFIAWTALFDHLLLALHLPFSESFIGSLSFASTAGYVIGGLACGYVTDHFLPTKMKAIIVGCCIANTVVTFVYSSSLPVAEATGAIAAVEDALSVGRVFLRDVPPASLGETGERVAKDRHLRPAWEVNATDAQLLAYRQFAEEMERACGHLVDEESQPWKTTPDETHPQQRQHHQGSSGATKAVPNELLLCADWGDLQQHHRRSHWPRYAPVRTGRKALWVTQLPHMLHADHDQQRRRGLAVVQGHTIAAVQDAAREADRQLRAAIPARLTLTCLSFIGGFFNGAAAPLFYELSAEVTYPMVGEAVSGNLMSVGENIGSLLFFQVVAVVVPERSVNWAFVAGMAACCAAAAAVKERYKRRLAFEALKRHQHHHHHEDRGSGDDAPRGIGESTELLGASDGRRRRDAGSYGAA